MTVITTPNAPQSWRPDQVAEFPAEDLIPDSLLMTIATRVGAVEGDAPTVRAPYVAVDPAADYVPEGDEIDEAEPGLDEVVIATKKVAVLVRVSREQIEQGGAADRIARSMSRSIMTKTNAAVMANQGAPTGLLAVPGIDTVGEIGDTLWALTDAVGEIEADGGAATNVVCHPRDWARLARIPSADGSNAPVLGDAAAAPQRLLSGLPVTVTSACSEGTALVVDKSEVCAAYGTLNLARSNDVYFASDSIGVRATLRAGWTVARPSRLKKLTVAGSPAGGTGDTGE